MQGITAIMDTFGDVIEEMGGLQDRLDNVELLQHRMASIVEGLSSQMAVLEPAVAALSEKEQMSGLTDSGEDRIQQSDDASKVDGMDQKLQINTTQDKISESDSAGTSSSITGTDMAAIECRLSVLETKLNNSNIPDSDDTGKRNLEFESIEKRLDALEMYVERQHKLEETVELIAERVSKLSVVCQKLISQIKGPHLKE